MRPHEHPIDEELRGICAEILRRNLSDVDRAAIESDDMFQTPHYCGGYDAGERAFTLSYYDQSGGEFWFTLSLAEIASIADGAKTTVTLLQP